MPPTQSSYYRLPGRYLNEITLKNEIYTHWVQNISCPSKIYAKMTNSLLFWVQKMTQFSSTPSVKSAEPYSRLKILKAWTSLNLAKHFFSVVNQIQPKSSKKDSILSLLVSVSIGQLLRKPYHHRDMLKSLGVKVKNVDLRVGRISRLIN